MATLVGEAIGIARGGLIIDFIRIIFFLIDAFVYSLCGGFYRVAIGMIDINKFMDTSPILSRVSDLIYSFLAIFMFFKVAFSLLTMIVDPTQIEDKQKGAAKLIQNIFICLALIVAVPAIFNGARELQKTVIDDQIIEKAFFGEGFENDTTYSNVGHKLAIASWSIFLHPSETLDKDAAAKKKWEEAFSLDTASNSGEALLDLNIYLNQRSVTSRYHIVYMWGISTIFGCYLLWTFIKLAIDFAYRSLKLFVLQLISPIAIISFIDPKSGKDGIFAKWTKECIKTYISLFVRIFCYALAAVVLVEFTREMNKEASILDIYAKITYLLAITALIKSGPKIFDNIFGTELSKDSETKFVTDMMRGVAGAGVGMVAGGISGAVVAGKTNNNVKKAALLNAWSGAKKGYESGKKGSITGLITGGIGTVNDVKKKYGYEPDKDKNKRIDKLRNMVGNVDAAKASRAAKISENDNALSQKIISSAKSNGHRYGLAIKNDDVLVNKTKKSQGGLAKDKIIHADLPNADEYMDLREAAAEKSMEADVVQRTLDIANASMQKQQSFYGNIGTDADRREYIVNLAGENAKASLLRQIEEARAYGNGDEDIAVISSNLDQMFSENLSVQKNLKIESIKNMSRDQMVRLVKESTGVDASSFSEEALRTHLTTSTQREYDRQLSNFKSSTIEEKIEINSTLVRNAEKGKIASFNTIQLNDEFDKANEDSVVAKFGQTQGQITADATKAKGESDQAKNVLDSFLKSEKGKAHARVDEEYGIAEGLEKAKEASGNHSWEN